jgi:hypothetical protein
MLMDTHGEAPGCSGCAGPGGSVIAVFRPQSAFLAAIG